MSRVTLTKKLTFSLRTLATLSYPRIAFRTIKEAMLGRDFDLSVVIADSKLVCSLNSAYRRTLKSTNILSFRLSDNEGEIFIDISRVKSEAIEARIVVRAHLRHLFIHGCAHLKGYRHGGTMDAYEHTMRAKFESV